MKPSDALHWPKKSREIHNHHFDSTIWNDFDFRSDDIVIATYTKSGTTWMQQIISQLLFKGEEGLEVAEMSPWLDLRVPPKEIKFMAPDFFYLFHRPVTDSLEICFKAVPSARPILTPLSGREKDVCF